MDLNCVRLCFEGVMVRADGTVQKITEPCYSNPIYNLKSSKTGEVKITRLSQYAGMCRGSDELWLLVEKVQRGNIQVQFYEESPEDGVTWLANGSFQDTDI